MHAHSNALAPMTGLEASAWTQPSWCLPQRRSRAVDMLLGGGCCSVRVLHVNRDSRSPRPVCACN